MTHEIEADTEHKVIDKLPDAHYIAPVQLDGVPVGDCEEDISVGDEGEDDETEDETEEGDD